MRKRIARIVANEKLLHALTSLVGRAAIGAIRTSNARSLGWLHGRLPLGSRVIGSKRIFVGRGFTAEGRVWMEAITEYAGEKFDPKIVIGENFSASGTLHVSAVDSVKIGNRCLFGSNIFIADHGHGDYRAKSDTQSDPGLPPAHRKLGGIAPVSIGDRCWLGDNVVILSGVVLGDGCIVGANSVVTSSMQPGAICAGAPAVVIKMFSAQSKKWLRAGPKIERDPK